MMPQATEQLAAVPRKSVLIVDDEHNLRLQLAKAMERRGFDVGTLFRCHALRISFRLSTRSISGRMPISVAIWSDSS